MRSAVAAQDDVSRLTKKLNTEVFARDQAIKRLENVRETLKENIDNLKATIDELKHTVDVKEGEKGELKKQLDKKDKDLLTSEMERRALKDALEKQRMATQKAEAEVQQINGQMQDAINDWKKKLDEQMASFQADMQEFMHMKSTYADLQTERKAVQALFESETKVTAQLRHGERMADVRIRALEDTVQEKDREIAILKDHIRELQERAEQDHRVILSLKEVEQENKRLKEKLAEERDTAVRRIEEAKAETRRVSRWAEIVVLWRQCTTRNVPGTWAPLGHLLRRGETSCSGSGGASRHTKGGPLHEKWRHPPLSPASGLAEYC